MAGKGQRFIDEGYTTPKQFIDVGGRTMIEWSFHSFDWKECEIVFIVRRDHIDEYAVDDRLRNLFGDEIKIVVAEEQTEGTVCSCLLAKEYINKDVPLGITTLDVFFEPKFSLSNFDTNIDGCLLTIETDNPAYSYCQVDENGFVSRTAEKEVISTHGNVGYYCFSSGAKFVEYGEKMVELNIRSKNEFYVAPLYNLMINDGCKITIKPIENQYHMGTPQELDDFFENHLEKLNDRVWN
tara:strand:- start:1038 stop:1754 length:717 start_codon:yes stop_codon:yes gene_type:complete